MELAPARGPAAASWECLTSFLNLPFAIAPADLIATIRSFLKAVRQLFLGPTQVGAAPQGGAMQAIARRNKNNRDGAVAEQTSPLEGG